jgi:plastocyanin
MTCRALALLAGLFLAVSATSTRANETAFTLVLKDHRFTPAELTIPANTRVRFVVKNMDPTPAEFESDQFRAEKVLPAGQEVSFVIGPLKPGTYEFHDEYHENESKSRLIVK